MLPAMHFIPHVEDASRALFHTCEMLSNALNALPDLTSRAPPVCLSPLSGFSLLCARHSHSCGAHRYSLESLQCCTCPRNTNPSDEAKSTKCWVFFFLSGSAILVTLLLVFSQVNLWHLPFIATTPCDSFTLCYLSPY